MASITTILQQSFHTRKNITASFSDKLHVTCVINRMIFNFLYKKLAILISGKARRKIIEIILKKKMAILFFKFSKIK